MSCEGHTKTCTIKPALDALNFIVAQASCDNVRKETMQAADNSEQPGLAMKADVFHKVIETMVIAFDRQPDLILVGLDDHDEMFYFKLDDWESHIPNDPMDCSPDEIPYDPMDCSP